MKIVFICQAVDKNDHILAGTIRWITAFAEKPEVEHVKVITLRKGEFVLPENVSVASINSKNRLFTLLKFYKEVLLSLIDRVDYFFIYQGGPYPVLLLPVKLLLRKPIFQWKAHPHISWAMRFYAKYCNTKTFTSTPNAFPLKLDNKIKVVGQGIDVQQFQMTAAEKKGDLVTIGRISPIKHIEEMLYMLAYCRDKYGKSYKLDIYGPVLEKDKGYKKHLERLLKELSLQETVRFCGPVKHEQVPLILSQYRLFLFFCRSALGRSAVEAMACGLPVLSTNPCVADILPEKLRETLIVPRDNPEFQAQQLIHLLRDQKNLYKIGKELRTIVIQNHTIDGLVVKILEEIKKCL